MRVINKRSSTKPERIFIEILKKHHISFKYKVKLDRYEIDFIIGKYAIEIDGHQQSALRNKVILDTGYQIIHYRNEALLKNRTEIEKDVVMKLK